MDGRDQPERGSPRPWRRNAAWPAPGHDVDPPPILDANGADVLPTSEWLPANEADIDLIVLAVNAYDGGGHG